MADFSLNRVNVSFLHFLVHCPLPALLPFNWAQECQGNQSFRWFVMIGYAAFLMVHSIYVPSHCISTWELISTFWLIVLAKIQNALCPNLHIQVVIWKLSSHQKSCYQRNQVQNICITGMPFLGNNQGRYESKIFKKDHNDSANWVGGT